MDHIRIDEGIKRGPRKKPSNSSGSSPSSKGELLPKLPHDPDVIRIALLEYGDGASFAALAAKHGVSKGALYGWLLGGLSEDEHTDLVTQALVSRVAVADAMLEGAEDPMSLAKAREMGRFARQDLERRRPNLYGPRQNVTLTSETADLGEKLRRSTHRIHGGEPRQLDHAGGAAKAVIDEAPPAEENPEAGGAYWRNES